MLTTGFGALQNPVTLKTPNGNITWGDGKNFVLFAGPDIIEDHGVPSALLAQELMNNGVPVTLGGTPRDWAQESSDMARDHIYDTLPACYTAKQPICPVLAVLPASYTADKYPFVAQRLKQAGYRLAAVLNSLLGTS